MIFTGVPSSGTIFASFRMASFGMRMQPFDRFLPSSVAGRSVPCSAICGIVPANVSSFYDSADVPIANAPYAPLH